MTKISVLIIAHNEEKYIEKCINSILKQKQKADEIILITHNCTDKTLEIAQKLPITTIPFKGKRGIVIARKKGLDCVSGDIILCIDGDSYAEEDWIEKMIILLNKNNILVGSQVKLKGTIYSYIYNIFNEYLIGKGNIARWIWGPSFGFYGKDKNLIKDSLEKSIEFSKNLNLIKNPEDYWLASFMKQYGRLAITNKTFVTQNVKESNSIKAILRAFNNIRNMKKINKFLSNYLR